MEELQFIREQENQEVSRIEVELIKISQLNSQLQLQVEESKRELNDKIRKLTELDELIAVLKDQKEIFKQEKRRDAEEDRKIIKELTDDIR